MWISGAGQGIKQQQALFSCLLTNNNQTTTWTPHDNALMMFIQHITQQQSKQMSWISGNSIRVVR